MSIDNTIRTAEHSFSELVDALKEESARADDLETKVTKLEKMVEGLEESVEALESQNVKLVEDMEKLQEHLTPEQKAALKLMGIPE